MKKFLIILIGLAGFIEPSGIGAQNFAAERVSVSGKLFINWTYDHNWGGDAGKWYGHIGFNAYRDNNMQKDHFFRNNNYTKRMVFEGGHNGFRWLGESNIANNGKPTGSLRLNTLMSLSPEGSLTLGLTDNKGVYGSGNVLKFAGTDWNSDPTEIYRFAVSPGSTQLRVRIGDGLNNSDKFLVGTSGNSAGAWFTSMAVTAGGRVGIKREDPTCELDVAGTVRAEEILVEAKGHTADHVFSRGYRLRDLSEVEAFVKANRHLPEIPPAAQMEERGVNLARMNKLLLQKVEELTLYAIDSKAEVDRLKKEAEQQREQRRELEATVHRMAQRLDKLERNHEQ